MSYRSDRYHHEVTRGLADDLNDSWRRTCVNSGAAFVVDTASGPTTVYPRIERVHGPGRFRVALPHGMVPADLKAQAHRLAAGMGYPMCRIVPAGPKHAEIVLLAVDPLTVTIPRAPALSSVTEPVRWGVDEEGFWAASRLTSGAHLIAQGASGSGKSVGTYGVLSQLREAPEYRVVGSDITSLLLAPWAERPDADAGYWHALGTARPEAHVDVLEHLVAEMDRRIAAMPRGRDSIPISRSTPLVLAVVEETPGLYKMLGSADPNLEKRARTLIGRLLGESRKAAMRVLLITQRADASIVGGFERGQASHTISWRVDSMAGLKMLHADVDPDTASAHATAEPGIALMSAPGVPLLRFRAPYVDYATYYAEVSGRSATDTLRAA